jgi:hypothetical protein
MRKKRTLKKPVQVTRFLREYYSENSEPTEMDLVALQHKILNEFGVSLDTRDLRNHFSDKRYRETRRTSAKSKRAPNKKSFEDLCTLRRYWSLRPDYVPKSGSEEMHAILRSTSLSESEIVQWFGQQRYKKKQEKQNLPAVTYEFSNSFVGYLLP